jgi:phage head maturation protease
MKKPTKLEKVFGKVNGIAMSTKTDLHGEKFTIDALQKMLDFHKQNPFVFHNHDRSQPPVGRVVSAKIVEIADSFGLQVETEVLNEEIWKKIESGELRGFSVGGTKTIE